MSGSLEGPVAKVGRAIEHYRTLKNDFLGGFDIKHRHVTPEAQREGLEYRFHVGKIDVVDSRFALVLGDGFYNMRCALDHLAFQLHVAELGDPLPPAVEKASQFPIYDVRPSDPPNQWNYI